MKEGKQQKKSRALSITLSKKLQLGTVGRHGYTESALNYADSWDRMELR
jgi:hypothetical protein